MRMGGLSAYPSPNFGPRRHGALPDLVVIHYTAMPTCAEAFARLCDPAAEVSAHYLISELGAVQALVPEELRAWHAGAGSWGGCHDVNSRAIGIELANRGDDPFPEPQMAALERLLADVLHRHGLPPEAVIAHSDMAPGRKGDPGVRFDWRRLALQGLSVWLDPPVAPPPPSVPGRGEGCAEPDAARFLADLAAFGYPACPPGTLLTAFRLRFRPWANGPLDAVDCALAAGLGRFAVDAPGVHA